MVVAGRFNRRLFLTINNRFCLISSEVRYNKRVEHN